MRLLLDTQAAVWAVDASAMLSKDIKQLLSDPQNEVFVSAVSLWEIAIKSALRRHSALPFSAATALFKFREAGFGILDMKAEHAIAVEDLPLLHADPFDRLLVAQALSEPMRLVSRDPQVVAYSDTVITW